MRRVRREALIRLARTWGMATVAAPCRLPLPARPIVELLQWAYREELPKTQAAPLGPAAPRGGWDKVARWAEELSLAGLDDNRFGVVPDLAAVGLPHLDAMVIHAAVVALDRWPLALPDGWNPLGDMPQLGAAGAAAVARALEAMTFVGRDGERWLRRGVGALVFRAAVTGTAPDWRMDAPRIDVERRENGQAKWFVRELVAFDGAFGRVSEEIERDGWDERAKRPRAGAYQKPVLAPDPVCGIVARGEYEIWRAALDALAGDLAFALSSAVPVAPDGPARPWEAGEGRAARVLPDISARPAGGRPARRRGLSKKVLTCGHSLT